MSCLNKILQPRIPPSISWSAGPILSTGDIMNEEQYHARGMFHEVTGSALRPFFCAGHKILHDDV